MTKNYAKVIVLDGDFAAYQQRLSAALGPGIDTGLLQVGVHELAYALLLAWLVAWGGAARRRRRLRQVGLSAAWPGKCPG